MIAESSVYFLYQQLTCSDLYYVQEWNGGKLAAPL